MTLAQAQVEKVWLNDLDVNVVAFWGDVIRNHATLTDSWMATSTTAADARRWQAELYPTMHGGRDLTDTDRAYGRLLLSQHGFSGDPQGGLADRTRVKDRAGIADRINKAHALLDGRARITQLDFEDVIMAPGDDVVMYLDPPYVLAGGMYRHGFSEADHCRLKDVLWRTRHRWVLSYDDHPLVRELYSDWCDFRIVADYGSGMHQGAKPVRRELLIMPKRNLP